MEESFLALIFHSFNLMCRDTCLLPYIIFFVKPGANNKQGGAHGGRQSKVCFFILLLLLSRRMNQVKILTVLCFVLSFIGFSCR